MQLSISMYFWIITFYSVCKTYVNNRENIIEVISENNDYIMQFLSGWLVLLTTSLNSEVFSLAMVAIKFN